MNNNEIRYTCRQFLSIQIMTNKLDKSFYTKSFISKFASRTKKFADANNVPVVKTYRHNSRIKNKSINTYPSEVLEHVLKSLLQSDVSP